MHGFIQAMYGTVLGVNFYKIATENDTDYLFSLPQIFYAALFCCTIIIVAHDWFHYHRIEPGENEKRSFWYYTPQIFSLFFLAEMFSSINDQKPQYWYGFSLGYTVFNIVNFLVSKRKRDYLSIIKYVTHINIGIAGIVFFGWIFPQQVSWEHFVALAFTMLVVVFIWYFETPKSNTNNVIQGEESQILIRIEQQITTILSNTNNTKNNITNIKGVMDNVVVKQLNDTMNELRTMKTDLQSIIKKP